MHSGGHITAIIALFVFLVGAFYILAPEGAVPIESQTIDLCKNLPIGGSIISNDLPGYQFVGTDVMPTKTNPTSYRQIRAGVYIDSKLFTKQNYSYLFKKDYLITPKKFDVYYPMPLAKTRTKLSQPQESISRSQNTDSFYLTDYSLIFLVNQVAVSGKTNSIKFGNQEFWKTDIYQDTNIINTKPVPAEIFFCPDNAPTAPPSPSIRGYGGNPDGSQIQLDFFDFSSNPTPLDPTLVLIE